MLGVGAFLGAAMSLFLLSHFKSGHLLLFSTTLLGIWMFLVVPLHRLSRIYVVPSLYIWVSMIGFNIPMSSLFLGILQMTSYTVLLLGLIISGVLATFFGAVTVTAISGLLMAIKTKGFKEVLTIDQPSSRVSVSRLEQKDV
ncbi:hypothetical protein HOO54_10770 [Bacillus sp. WMMC1349]|uniref:hypothetical protein n=1 Tax=Bacillus sp. WMMC1349 TaxID=2736254 RepID=UPI001552D7C6|nr:hypothetical protein [Bacillus sp. WMMC1349]NPC92697.1 hypothetical protein [Bacillus sp. WMMC1349]